MLQNWIYRGEITHKRERYPGEHQPITDEALWDEVQAKLASNAVERHTGERTKSPSLLAGLLFDSEGHRMTPTHAIKKGTRYRYYVSRPLIGQSRANVREGLRLPARDIEQLVVTSVGQLFSEPSRVAELLSFCVRTAVQQRELLQRAAKLAADWPTLTVAQMRLLPSGLVQRIVVHLGSVDIQLLPNGIAAVLGDPASPDQIPAAVAAPEEPPIILSIPTQFRRVGLGIKILVDGPALAGQASKADPKLVKLIARAHHLSNELAESSSERLADLAQAAGLTSSYFTRVLRLAYLAPDITRAIIEGRHPRDLTAQKLLAHSRLPLARGGSSVNFSASADRRKRRPGRRQTVLQQSRTETLAGLCPLRPSENGLCPPRRLIAKRKPAETRPISGLRAETENPAKSITYSGGESWIRNRDAAAEKRSTFQRLSSDPRRRDQPDLAAALPTRRQRCELCRWSLASTVARFSRTRARRLWRRSTTESYQSSITTKRSWPLSSI
jgi:hypothetical protein